MSRAISPSRPSTRSSWKKCSTEPTDSAVRSAMDRPRKRTCNAVGLSRLPSHDGHASSTSSHSSHESSTWSSVPLFSRSSSQSMSLSLNPVPKQVSHHPCFELKENKRGSSSGKLLLQDGQARL